MSAHEQAEFIDPVDPPEAMSAEFDINNYEPDEAER